MKCQITSELNNTQDTALIVFVDNNKKILSTVTTAQTTHIENFIETSKFNGASNSSVLDYNFSVEGYQGLLLVGLGKIETLNGNNLQKIATTIHQSFTQKKTKIAICINDILNIQQFHVFALALLNASYVFDTYKSKKNNNILAEISFISHDTDLQAELDFVTATFKGQTQARDLGNAPANFCYPESIAEQAKQLATEYSDCLSVEVLGEAEMEELKMGCFLSVSQGSVREGQLITFNYKGEGAKNTDSPIVLVGKGVTFDTGGISIKPGAGMEEMKFDMCGAASVFGTIKALCEARLPINVIGTMACAENMPSGNATRPGDIVTSMSGKTVEILNTDAEGRLVLSDALTYVEKYNPSVVINMATLTGACIVALGHIRSAMYTKNIDLANNLSQASDYAHDRIWQMPLDDDYQQQLNSPCADIQNIGGAAAGSVTAACFLSRFTENYPWAHLDIAGTAWISGSNRNATGRPVPLLMQYIRQSL